MKLLGFWLVFLSTTYVVMVVLNWYFLSLDTFMKLNDARDWSEDYLAELYTYSKDLEELKFIHAVLLFCITLVIACMTAKNRVLSKKQYGIILALTLLITLLYILPLLVIAKKTFEH